MLQNIFNGHNWLDRSEKLLCLRKISVKCPPLTGSQSCWTRFGFEIEMSQHRCEQVSSPCPARCLTLSGGCEVEQALSLAMDTFVIVFVILSN